jgi:lipoprotein signal peptidase
LVGVPVREASGADSPRLAADPNEKRRTLVMSTSQDSPARLVPVSRIKIHGHPQMLLISTLAVFVLDQSSKVTARTLHIGASAQNDSHPVHWWWVLPIFAVIAALAPSRRVAIFSGLFLGGFLGNLVDQHFWPGGIPDFIYYDQFYWNLADLCIVAGLALLLASPLVRIGAALFQRRPQVATESSLDS